VKVTLYTYTSLHGMHASHAHAGRLASATAGIVLLTRLVTTTEGQTLKRLLVQRWTGHLQCALAVKKSRQELIDALEIVAESHRVTTEVAVEAQGLLAKVLQPQFVFMADVAVTAITSQCHAARQKMQLVHCNKSNIQYQGNYRSFADG